MALSISIEFTDKGGLNLIERSFVGLTIILFLKSSSTKLSLIFLLLKSKPNKRPLFLIFLNSFIDFKPSNN